MESDAPLHAAECSGVSLHGRRRRGLVRRTPPIAASGNGAPLVVLGVHVGAGCDERSDDSAIVVVRRQVQRGVAIAAHGGAVRAGVPQYPTGTRTQNSTQAPRVDLGKR
jgi:hypothetical protein